MKIKSLGLKVSLIVALIITVIICIIFSIVSVQSKNMIMDLTAKEAAADNVMFITEVENLKKDALTYAKIAANSKDTIDAIVGNDDAALKKAIVGLLEGVDTVMVVDPNGDVLMRAHNDQKGDNVMSQKIVSTTLNTGEGISTIAKGATVGMATRGSAVIKDSSGNIIGAVVCGHDLSKPKYVDAVKEYTNSEVTFFDGDTRLSTTIIDENGDRVIGTQAKDEVVETVINQRQNYGLQINLFGSEYYAYYSPLIIDNEVIGMLFTGVGIDDALAGYRAMMNMLLTIGIICGVISIILVLVFNIFSVSRPLKKIGVLANKISTGDIGVLSSTVETINVRSSDEVGALAKELDHAYQQLRGYVREIRERMHGLASGDLTAESTYDFQGDFLLIKDSINDHIRNLNHTMTEINNSSMQVAASAKNIEEASSSIASGSSQMADGAQSLAEWAGCIRKQPPNNKNER